MTHAMVKTLGSEPNMKKTFLDLHLFPKVSLVQLLVGGCDAGIVNLQLQWRSSLLLFSKAALSSALVAAKWGGPAG